MSAMFHPPPQPGTRPPSVNVGVSRYGVTQHYSHTCNNMALSATTTTTMQSARARMSQLGVLKPRSDMMATNHPPTVY